ncbi:hypothetical protein SAMN05216226_104132 [Halovenus aranensis]|uniref:Uncharacterized protein n=1 Tax=Halovenus aranensis TaxID=890420 RepID=A0A1G8U9Y2_9EURY|nr:hypothetical protein [Halovenus aranensis]SDJ50562.1 hypothetical protein SAMN05216226_104132 [Halovenus aranensis]
MGESTLPTGSNAYFYLGVGVVVLTGGFFLGTTGEYTIGSGPLWFDPVVAAVAGAGWLILIALAALYQSARE